MEEKTVAVRNGMFETKLRTDGSGTPLLFLHGAGGLRGWDTFLVELAKDFTVYAPAHPGFETSTGIEHIDDIKADFEQAFEKVFAKELVG